MRIALLACLALAACAPQPAPGGEVAIGDNLSTTAEKAEAEANALMSETAASPACDGAKANGLIGKPVDAALQTSALQLTGARTTRIVPPGAMVTMDFRGDRLNIDTDAQNRAIRFHCG